ncbi:MAG: zinc-binding dehydrogenase [Pseudomonadota bacterium]
MRAVLCQNGELSVTNLPEPQPEAGHVVVEVLRCGICGTDLHARHQCDGWSHLMTRAGFDGFQRSHEAVVFGHEFCGEVLDYGAGTAKSHKPGTRVVAVPILRRGSEFDLVGNSARSPGAYAERMLVQESLMVPIPNGLSSDLATLTEPMAVAWHAVRRGEVKKRDVAIVIGCGPVGLGVICMLKAAGVATVVAADFSAARRNLATACGADVVIDPKVDNPYTDWKDVGYHGALPSALELVVGTREKLGKLPAPWWVSWKLAERLGAANPVRPVIFECVGVPGILRTVIDGAPLFSRVVVVGVCMQADTIEPAMAITKEIDLRFVFGYTPLEYRDALHMIADGKVRCAPLFTGTVGLDGVEGAFAALVSPELHAKILIDPKRSGSEIVSPTPR